ncbi:MAG: phosphatidate cytidylyltransferase [Rhodobacteraceae bacterium]|nr:phosphatidate cytidylyltransferase [Paracoccaceae bacterium]
MSQTQNSRWGDLGTRVVSGLIMVTVGVGAVILGGVVFHFATALVCGLMIWEMCRLLNPEQKGLALQAGLLQGAVLMGAPYLPPMLLLPFLLAPALAIASQARAYRGLLALFMGAIALAGYQMLFLRDVAGFHWLVWLVALVVLTDVAGYFFGRMIGGPKFWPSLSPKKTWAGILGGWVCAGAVGIYFVQSQGAGTWLVPFSISVAFAAQMGDIAESALKRHVGAKDSSDLIPGHGGLMDRFDGMAGASLYVMAIVQVLGLSLGGQ